MTETVRGNELSQQNLKQLNNAINLEADSHIADKTNTDSSTASFVKEHRRNFERIDVILEEPIPKPNLEREREMRVRRSYAAFCEDFILSGPASPKRVFDMTMGTNNGTEEIEQREGLNTDPTLESQRISGDAMPLERDELSTLTSVPLASRMSASESTQSTCHPQEMKQRTKDATKRSLDEDEDFKPESPFTHCSICHANGYLMIYPKTADVTFHHADDAVKEYRFASKNVPHYFCTNCGTSVYGKAEIPEKQHIMAVNVRTLSGVDLKTLKIHEHDGRGETKI
ncbi:hypothetical protein PoHVEF18_004381 [Penicillium ochrochloron]